MTEKIKTYKDIDKTILKALPNPSEQAYEIKIKIQEYFPGVKTSRILPPSILPFTPGRRSSN